MSDMIFLLSGGLGNTNPDNSLGGIASKKVLSGDVDALFDQVSKTALSSGKTDYRCIYVFNNLSNMLTNAGYWLESTSTVGGTISVGTVFENEVQQMLIVGDPIGGTFKLNYTDNIGITQTTGAIQWSPNLQQISGNIAGKINSIHNLSCANHKYWRRIV